MSVLFDKQSKTKSRSIYCDWLWKAAKSPISEAGTIKCLARLQNDLNSQSIIKIVAGKFSVDGLKLD